jgi:hypothetical protein
MRYQSLLSWHPHVLLTVTQGQHPCPFSASHERRALDELQVAIKELVIVLADLMDFSSEDGRIVLRDTRADHRWSYAQGILQHTAEFTSARWHPTMEHIFLTSDSRGAIHLRDTRMAFGPLKNRSKQGIVRTVSSSK